MNHNISISPFEEQVLHALTAGKIYTSNTIHQSGMAFNNYPYTWSGPPHHRARWSGYPTYPKINLALGRLAKRGVVERVSWSDAQDQGYDAGRWRLTELGTTLMGIE